MQIVSKFEDIKKLEVKEGDRSVATFSMPSTIYEVFERNGALNKLESISAQITFIDNRYSVPEGAIRLFSLYQPPFKNFLAMNARIIYNGKVYYAHGNLSGLHEYRNVYEMAAISFQEGKSREVQRARSLEKAVGD